MHYVPWLGNQESLSKGERSEDVYHTDYHLREGLRTCGSPGGSVVRNLPVNAGHMGSVSRSGRYPWRKKWQPAAVSLPGESHGQRSLAGYSPQGHTESDTAEHAHMHLGDKIKYCSHTFDLIFVLRSYFTGSTWILHFL